MMNNVAQYPAPTAEELMQSEKSRERMKNLPWYMKDKYGWPIERPIDRPIFSFVRVVVQNIRKVIG